MSEESILSDGALPDPRRLFSLLPRRIPVRVKNDPHRDRNWGFVHVLIPTLYPDGQPIGDIYCGNLFGTVAWKGSGC